MSKEQTICWSDSSGEERCALWRSESGASPPKQVLVADDRMNADTAFRLACEGTSLLWHGDFHNARQLLAAMARRTDRKPPKPGASPEQSFHLYRQARSRRARILMLLLPVEAGHVIPLRRAPDVRLACEQVYGQCHEPYVVSLRELQGVLGAGEWRNKRVHMPALGESITPHYGVFSPVRGEYVDLVSEAPLPSQGTAFDIGTGTGVLAAVLARRGVRSVVATDLDARALACAQENTVAGRLDARPLHPRAHDHTDPLHSWRKAEVTSLWRLAVSPGAAD
ncbi:methyltransferase [Streptomyces sp. NPDC101110]|uniref:methyltransferase n=1 Tax=Streptomyces sp. NPDC101110 TaxID=3366104 RepID=UPI003803113C